MAPADLVNMRPSAITALGLSKCRKLQHFPDLSVRGISNWCDSRSAIGSTRSLPRCRRRCLQGMLGKRATLSSGQRQMLAVGRALMSDPRL
jgi:ABC-type branched-subunit amino acid transport system ATPase component